MGLMGGQTFCNAVAQSDERVLWMRLFRGQLSIVCLPRCRVRRRSAIPLKRLKMRFGKKSVQHRSIDLRAYFRGSTQLALGALGRTLRVRTI